MVSMETCWNKYKGWSKCMKRCSTLPILLRKTKVQATTETASTVLRIRAQAETSQKFPTTNPSEGDPSPSTSTAK